MKVALTVVGVLLVASIGGGATTSGPAAGGSTSTTLVDPTTAPTGGEPGIVAGPPNPGYRANCTAPPPAAGDVRGRVTAIPVDPSKACRR